jgi:hypothetical protein
VIDQALRAEIIRIGREVAPDGDFQQLVAALAQRCQADFMFAMRVCANCADAAVESARAEYDKNIIRIPSNRSLLNDDNNSPPSAA